MLEERNTVNSALNELGYNEIPLLKKSLRSSLLFHTVFKEILLLKNNMLQYPDPLDLAKMKINGSMKD